LLPLQGVLDAAHSVLDFALHLIGNALILEFLITPQVASAFFDLAAQVRGGALNAVLIDCHGLRLTDTAYWMKGCSSLGFLRYAALVRINGGGKRRLALVDLKEAVEPAAPAAPGAEIPDDLAERVVAGARALSPNLGERMLPVRLLDKPVVIPTAFKGGSAGCGLARHLIRLADQERAPWPGSPSPARI